jgi:hypothetical protein
MCLNGKSATAILRKVVFGASLGIIVLLISGSYVQGLQGIEPVGPENNLEGSGSKDREKYRVDNMGEVDPGYGIPLGFTTFTAPDGVKVRVFYLVHDDPGQAIAAFKQELDRAVKIISRNAKKNQQGRITGERARILVQVPKSSSLFHAVIWTEGSTFHKIISGSLADVLDLEKSY